MNTNQAINALLDYAENNGLIDPSERRWALNTVLDVLKLPALADGELRLKPTKDLTARRPERVTARRSENLTTQR